VRRVPRFELVEWVVENFKDAKYPLGFSEVLGDAETYALIDWEPILEEVGRYHGYAWECHAGLVERLPEVLEVGEGEALLTQGTSEANSLVIQALVEPGQSVIVDVPIYEPISILPELFGGRTIPVPRLPEEEWRLDLQEVQEATGKDTAAIFTCNLHNPTGAALRREELRALADIASDAGATLVVDEIFRPYVNDDMVVPPVREVAPEAVSTGSVSKVYAWPSSRLGWVTASRELVDKLDSLKNFVAPSYAMVSEAVAFQLLDHLPSLRDRARTIASKGTRAVADWVGSRDDVTWVPPYAGIISFPRFEGISDTLSLAKRAMKEHAVMTSPGEFFGMPGHLRIGVGHPDVEVVEEGLRLLGLILDSWQD
jgi:aspartate/methionine/tyrosine aminotransferase